jgi:hypothetical protein
MGFFITLPQGEQQRNTTTFAMKCHTLQHNQLKCFNVREARNNLALLLCDAQGGWGIGAG